MSELETIRSSDLVEITGVPCRSVLEKQRQIAQNFTIFDDLVSQYTNFQNKMSKKNFHSHEGKIQWRKHQKRPFIAYTKKMFENSNQQVYNESSINLPPPEFVDSGLRSKFPCLDLIPKEFKYFSVKLHSKLETEHPF